jgi:hypothetical protein
MPSGWKIPVFMVPLALRAGGPKSSGCRWMPKEWISGSEFLKLHTPVSRTCPFASGSFGRFAQRRAPRGAPCLGNQRQGCGSGILSSPSLVDRLDRTYQTLYLDLPVLN